jgi:hypothetical protein
MLDVLTDWEQAGGAHPDDVPEDLALGSFWGWF